MFKTDPERAGAVIRFALNLARLYGLLAQPFVPDAGDKILNALGVEARDWPGDIAAEMQSLTPGMAFSVPENLFAKITDDAREEMAARFAGS